MSKARPVPPCGFSFAHRAKPWHSAAMRNLIFAAPLALAACAVPEPDPRIAACHAARTYGQAYGTPDNRGPCWWRTIAHASGYGITNWTVEGPRGFANLTFEGRRMAMVSEGARF